jgi:transketolase
MQAFAPYVPTMLGGAADLAESTEFKGEPSLGRGRAGRNVHFGVREHAMGAVVNGMALHGGIVKPYGSTFLIFSDYMRPAIRLSALMRLPVVWVFSHDSVGRGEDGPTHQPVEHYAALRAIPGLTVIRPADAAETAEAWRIVLEDCDGPVCLLLTRQAVPVLDRSRLAAASGLARGAYVISDPAGRPDAIIAPTGSEVALALRAQNELASEGISARVVSIPSWELLDAQPDESRSGGSVSRSARCPSIASAPRRRSRGTPARIHGADRCSATAHTTAAWEAARAARSCPATRSPAPGPWPLATEAIPPARREPPA